MRKIIKVILIARINYMATTHNLLLKIHFSNRHRLCIETKIYYSFKKIYVVWNKNKIGSLFIIDISTVYFNISHQRLWHKLRKKRIDVKVVNEVALFLTNHQAIIKINKHSILKLFINLGLPQNLQLFSILYFFYNKDFFDNYTKKKVDVQSYIDEITFIAINKLVKKNNQKLARVHNEICKAEE